MLCSRCKKNTAVVFVNRLDEIGINPLEALAKQANLSQSDLEDMTSQFETMFKDLSENMSEEELNDMMMESEESLNEMTPDSLGSIFSGLFGFKNNEKSSSADSSYSQKSDKTQKVKENKKQN